MRCDAVAMLVVVPLFSTSLAGAATGTYAIDWSSCPGCPDVSELHREIAARSDLVLDESGTRFQVSLERDAARGCVASAVQPDGATRTIRANDCSDVVAGVAFIIVGILDPARPLGDSETSENPASAEEVSSPPWQFYAGAGAAVAGGRTPEPMLMGGLFFELWREQVWFLRGIRFSASFGASDLDAASGSAVGRSYQGVTESCPLGVGAVSLCGGIELGALEFQSSTELSAEHTWRFSAAARVGVQLRWVWSDAWLTELSGGVWLPFSLDEYVVRRTNGSIVDVHEVGPSGYASISLGYRL